MHPSFTAVARVENVVSIDGGEGSRKITILASAAVALFSFTCPDWRTNVHVCVAGHSSALASPDSTYPSGAENGA